ncbi:hypothetical protein Hanom_Chr05g00455691 [Helianthus anomalus]
MQFSQKSKENKKLFSFFLVFLTDFLIDLHSKTLATKHDKLSSEPFNTLLNSNFLYTIQGFHKDVNQTNPGVLTGNLKTIN